MTNEIECSSCGKQRAELRVKNSELMPGMKLYLCNDCSKARFEPRWVIILAGRAPGGIDKVSKHISKHLYVGEEITAIKLIG